MRHPLVNCLGYTTDSVVMFNEKSLYENPIFKWNAVGLRNCFDNKTFPFDFSFFQRLGNMSFMGNKDHVQNRRLEMRLVLEYLSSVTWAIWWNFYVWIYIYTAKSDPHLNGYNSRMLVVAKTPNAHPFISYELRTSSACTNTSLGWYRLSWRKLRVTLPYETDSGAFWWAMIFLRHLKTILPLNRPTCTLFGKRNNLFNCDHCNDDMNAN